MAGPRARIIPDRIEDVEWLLDADASLTEILERLRVSKNTFHQSMRRAGRMDLYWRAANREPDAEFRRKVSQAHLSKEES